MPALTGGGTAPVRIYGEHLLGVGGIQIELRFTGPGGLPSDAFAISRTGGSPDYGGLAVSENAAVFPSIFPVYDPAGEWVGFISLDGDVDIGAKTLLMTINVDYAAAASPGTYAVATDDVITMVGGTYGNIPFDLAAGSITIAYWQIPGDANRDCRVNVLDLISVRNKLGLDPESGDNVAADVNEDGSINILDLIYIRNRLASACPPQ